MNNVGDQREKHTRTDGSYIDYIYDNIGQLKTAKGKESGGTYRLNEQFGYAYDGAWNLSYRTNNGLVQNFTHNGLNQLTAAGRTTLLTVGGVSSATATSVTVSSATQTNTANLYGDTTFAAAGFNLADGTNTFKAVATDALGRNSTNTVTVYLPASVSFAYDLNGNLTNDGNRVIT